eukprot:TRINITY_DN10334_c0_g1_i2.p1 TRINITY_DN10334_c0_g1~~TRINITY_DN10334_c0_g1_i2.p1  ORF type:complete len:546 (-),score=77.15 TRINITY_DN10334_c0_g1_i2:1005-2591(-)
MAWEIPKIRNCSSDARGILPVAIRWHDVDIATQHFGDPAAIRSLAWQKFVLERNATCLAMRSRKAAPVGWQLSFQGGWRQVQRSWLGSQHHELVRKYANKPVIVNFIRVGKMPPQLKMGVQALPSSGGVRLPKGLAPGPEQLYFAACWRSPGPGCLQHGFPPDRAYENMEPPEELSSIVESGKAQPTPSRKTHSFSDCWNKTLTIQIEGWTQQELCCAYGGNHKCWSEIAEDDGTISHTSYASCCQGRQVCNMYEQDYLKHGPEARCWNLVDNPARLSDVLEIVHVWESRSSTSHARILARLMLTIGIGNEILDYSPPHDHDGYFGGIRVVEVGVHHGNFAMEFLTSAEQMTMPVKSYTLIDTWAPPPIGVAGGQLFGEGSWDEASTQGSALAAATLRLARRWPRAVRFLQTDSHTAARWLRGDDEKFDLIYIDAQHDYDSVWEDLVAWWPLLKVGGLFAGDDYTLDNPVGNDYWGVKRAVDEFAWQTGNMEYLLAPIRRCWFLPKVKDVPSPKRPDWLKLEAGPWKK